MYQIQQYVPGTWYQPVPVSFIFFYESSHKPSPLHRRAPATATAAASFAATCCLLLPLLLRRLLFLQLTAAGKYNPAKASKSTAAVCVTLQGLYYKDLSDTNIKKTVFTFRTEWCFVLTGIQ